MIGPSFVTSYICEVGLSPDLFSYALTVSSMLTHTQICHENPSKAAEESGNTDTVKVLKAGGCVVVCPCQIHIRKNRG